LGLKLRIKERVVLVFLNSSKLTGSRGGGVLKAILITEDHYNALGVLRSLGENGISIIVIVLKKGKTFIEHSRYAIQCFKVERTEKNIIDLLKKITSNDDLYIVYPLSDFAAMVVDSHYNEFEKNLIVPHMQGNMKKYLNKDFVKKEAMRHGLTVAEGKIINTRGVCASDWDLFPAILKPVLSIEGVKGDIVRVDDFMQMHEQLDVLNKKGYTRVLVEQYITGVNEHMIEVMGYCSKRYGPVICGVVEKIREYPLRNGSTSYARIIQNHKSLDLNSIVSFLKDTQFYGLFDIEFKYADGKAYFIECNFRNGAPSYAITIYGNNIPLLWLNDAIEGNQEKNVTKYKDMYFMCEQNDVINMLKGHIPPLVWLKEFIKSNKIFFSIKDPMPNLVYYFNILKKRSKNK